MRKLIFLMATGLVLAGTSLSVHAATSGPFTTSTPIPLTLTDWSGTLLFPQFNPSLGTLISVQLDFSSTLTTTLTVSNGSGSASSGTAKTELQVTVQDAGSHLTAPELDLNSPAYSYSLAGGDSTTSGLLSKNGSSSDLYSLAAVLTEFTGAGNISLNGSTFTQTLLANTGGNTDASQISDGSLTGTVTSNYTAVPEPSTIRLVITGLLVALVIRRRKV
jgi:hypothetical protein